MKHSYSNKLRGPLIPPNKVVRNRKVYNRRTEKGALRKEFVPHLTQRRVTD